MPDFKIQLRRQWDFLQRSCRDFDAGCVDEGVRMAVPLRVLFHDTGNSTSLLKHLGIKDTVRLLTTFEPGFSKDDKTGIMSISIPMWLDSTGARRPPLDSLGRHEFVPAGEWWEEVVMGSNRMPTRKDIILSAANQDGGAHVDASPDEKTKELIKELANFQFNLAGSHSPKNCQTTIFISSGNLPMKC